MIRKTLPQLVTLALLCVPTVARSQTPAANEVCLYDGRDFTGERRCFQVEPWMRHKLVHRLSDFGFNDRPSSLRVGAEVRARLFEDVFHCGWKSEDYDRDVPALGEFWDGIASSLMVIPRGRSQAGLGVTLRDYKADPKTYGFTDKVKSSVFLPLPERMADTEATFKLAGQTIDNQLEDVWLPPGIEIELYDGGEFHGNAVKFPGLLPRAKEPGAHDHFVLDDFGLNDKISSIKIRPHGGYWQPAPKEVLLCKRHDYIAPCRSFHVADGARHELAMRLEDVGMDGARSIGVGSEVEVWLFGGKWFDEPRRVVTESTPSLGIKPVSMVVHMHRGGSPDGIFLNQTFFPAPELEGEWGSVTLWDLDGKIASVRLCGPGSLTLWEDSDYRGKSLTLPPAGASPPARGTCADFKLADLGFKNLPSSYRAWMKPKMLRAEGLDADALTGEAMAKVLQAQAAATAAEVAKSFVRGFERETNRPEGRYKELLLDAADPVLCAKACLDDLPTCKAFTYFAPGFMRETAYCSLKDKVTPERTRQPCCISGVVRPSVLAAAPQTSSGPAPAVAEKSSTALETVVTAGAQPGVQKKPSAPATGTVGTPPTVQNLPTTPPIVGTAPGSGVTPAPASQLATSFEAGFEYETNRPSGRYKELLGLTSPELCAQACLNDLATCRAFTWFAPGFMVRPAAGGQEPAEPLAESYCSLKSTVPPKATGQPCCVSGVVKGALIAARLPHSAATTPPPASAPAAGASLPQPQLPPAAPPPVTPPGKGYFEDFDDPLDASWQFVGSGMKVQDQRLTCQHTAGDPPTGALWSLPLGASYIVTFEHTLGTGIGAAGFNVRTQEPRSNYRLWVSPKDLEIARQAAGDPPAREAWMGWVLQKPGNTHVYAIKVSGGQIQVHVNDSASPYISWTDPQPLPPGVVAFGCANGTGFAFDSITVTPLLSLEDPSAIPINIPEKVSPQNQAGFNPIPSPKRPTFAMRATLVQPPQRVRQYLDGMGLPLAELRTDSSDYPILGQLVRADVPRAESALTEDQGVALFTADGRVLVVPTGGEVAGCMIARGSECSGSGRPEFTARGYPGCFSNGPLVDPCEAAADPQPGQLAFVLGAKVGNLWDGLFYCAGSGCLGIGRQPGLVSMDPGSVKKK